MAEVLLQLKCPGHKHGRGPKKKKKIPNGTGQLHVIINKQGVFPEDVT